MAQSKAHSDDRLKSFVKTSNTGHAESPAKGAPMSAKKTKFLGAEQTSDGRKAEAKKAASRTTKGRKRDFARTKLARAGTSALSRTAAK